MGFEEMPTNNFVESSFWNFDALFQPQQHPAHDSHDPGSRRYLPEDYVERVKLVLESGGYGSKGYGYDWKGKKLIIISFGHTQLQFLLEYFTCLLSSVMHFCCCPSREMNHQPEEIEQDQSTKPSINYHTKPAPLCNSYHHQIQGVRCNQKPACCFQCHPNHRAQLFFSVNPARHPGTQSSGRRHCSLGPSSVANQASSEYQCLPTAHT
ncbi:uncharacterized protein LOC135648887 isoform X2 [Musa acuminata AAA Group]|uniref:uncharacterized protein LOC135648887 isoform X2 n=1 Tax=Musa acuminata AAA Group TaxID=214697 RepID=UPI0031E43847